MDRGGSLLLTSVMPIQATKRGNEIDVAHVKDWLWQNCECETSTLVIEEPGGTKSAKAAYSMGCSFGALRAIAVMLGFRVERITPQSWQKPMLKCKPGDTKPAAITKARELWPHHDFRATPKCRILHDGMVDAALMCEHYRVTHCAMRLDSRAN